MENIGKVVFKYEDGSFSEVFTEREVIRGVVKQGNRPVVAYASGFINRLWLRRVVTPCLKVGKNIEIIDDVDKLIEIK